MITVFFAILISLSANAYEGPVSSAMGGSGRSSIIPGETTLNPAAIAHIRGYHVTASYQDYTFEPTGKAAILRASFVDSNEDNMVPAAFTYGKNAEDQEFHLGVSKFIFRSLALGIEIERYISDPKVGYRHIENDISIGALYAITTDWGVGLVGRNLLRTNLAALDQSVAIASSYAFGKIARVQFDYLLPMQNNDQKKSIIMMGVESHFVHEFPLRTGFRRDNLRNTTFWTAGAGWVGPKIALNYGFEKNVNSSREAGHSIDVRVYF